MLNRSIKKIGFVSAFILPALLIFGYYAGGPLIWSIHVFVFLIIPLMDYLVKKDNENIAKEAVSQVAKERFYKWVTFGWVYIQFAVLFWGLFVVSTIALTTDEWIALVTGMALVTGGIGITVAHELGHKSDLLEQFYSKVLLMTVCYMHFFIEHNRGHHVRVATPEDPATSRFGESFYSFWFRSVKDGYLSAWDLENERLRKRKISPFSFSNQMIQFHLITLLFILLTFFVFSWIQSRWVWEVPVFFIAQSILAFSLLEAVNYLEHYGMERKKLPNGFYENVTPLHSWNASQRISNFFLFQLQRHSDHHWFASKRYQVLDHHEESPQLPAGYSAMILVAFVPPLWYYLMNPRLQKWKEIQAMESV
ncbi:alkane 1-monooxygenase [Algoriphagus boseongensis]|uniref:Alkane 1-monooxygenase n=1 Tax=Algoriphagus boseongensis TaxID=1442587 RepID=A0A4R6T1L0_9BACT|nr:alkane 1-monooxygenase [Algoriphagus boseongensis]TDQ13510.1 alkane 1-monooxygenase [Algoriphagus boseongensis]